MSEDVYIHSVEAGELTAALWDLSDPQPTRGTTGLFPVETEVDGSTCLRVRRDFSIPVREDATLGDELAGILQRWIEEELLPVGTIESLANYIVSMRGKRMVVYQAFPKLFQLKDAGNPEGLGRTQEQMIEEGRLEVPGVL